MSNNRFLGIFMVSILLQNKPLFGIFISRAVRLYIICHTPTVFCQHCENYPISKMNPILRLISIPTIYSLLGKHLPFKNYREGGREGGRAPRTTSVFHSVKLCDVICSVGDPVHPFKPTLETHKTHETTDAIQINSSFLGQPPPPRTTTPQTNSTIFKDPCYIFPIVIMKFKVIANMNTYDYR